MAATDYTEFQDLAVDLLGDSGRQVTIQRFSDPVAADPTKPWRAAPAAAPTSTQRVYAVFTEYNVRLVDGERIKVGDIKALVPSRDLKFTPNTRDRVVDGSKTYSVVDTKETKPGPLSIIFELQLREG